MKRRLPIAAASVLGSVLLSVLSLSAQTGGTYVQHPIRFAISAPLGELVELPQPLTYGFREENPVRYIPTPPFGPVVDTVEQDSVAGSGANYALGADLVGLGLGFPNFTVQETPPDTNMAVGDTQIVDWVDDSYVVCSKSSPYTCGSPFSGKILWQNLGGPCYAEADGDIIAQWDVAAHRWLLAAKLLQCPPRRSAAILRLRSRLDDGRRQRHLLPLPVPCRKQRLPRLPQVGCLEQ